MSKFSCINNCKKTKQLKESSYCTGTFENVNGKIVFGCDAAMSAAENREKNFLTCHFYDMDIKDSCKTCQLYCKENLNPKVVKAEEASKNIKTLLNSLGPMAQFSGMDPSAIKNAFDTLDSQKINTNTSVEIEETIKIANYARDILTSVMSGKPVNITEFKRVKEEIEKKYKK